MAKKNEQVRKALKEKRVRMIPGRTYTLATKDGIPKLLPEAKPFPKGQDFIPQGCKGKPEDIVFWLDNEDAQNGEITLYAKKYETGETVLVLNLIPGVGIWRHTQYGEGIGLPLDKTDRIRTD